MPSPTVTYDRESARISSSSYELSLGRHGELVGLRVGPEHGARREMLEPGASTDLWRVRYADGQIAFSGNLPEPVVAWNDTSSTLNLAYMSDDLAVEVRLVCNATSVAMSARVVNTSARIVKYIFLPHALRFSTRGLRRFLFPKTYGVSLGPGFFARAKRMETGYPGPMDFMHLETDDATLSFRGEQNIAEREPFSDAEPFLVPARLSVGGLRPASSYLGELSHGHHVWLEHGEEITTPTYRISVQQDLVSALDEYASANGISRSLEEKMPGSWKDFARSIVAHCEVYSADDARRLARDVPPNTTVHYSSYLPNGFDRYYPVHLPPHPSFGTEDEFAAAMRSAREAGRRTLLYTNYTWWCTDSPMLVEHGNRGLQLREDGSPILEYYYEQTGFTASMWSPVHREFMMREIERLTEMGCDMVLIDQLSARPFKPPFLTEDAFWDFNAACPRPYAAPQGLADAAKAVSRVVPLSTEVWDNGPVDYLTNWVSQFCGFHVEGLRVEEGVDIARPASPAEAVRLDNTAPTMFVAATGLAGDAPRTGVVLDRFHAANGPAAERDVSFYPLTHHILHDKAAFTWHDLAVERSASDARMLTITMLLGFQITYHAGSRGEPAAGRWRRFAERPGRPPHWPDEETSAWLATLTLIAETFPIVAEPLRDYAEVEPDRHAVVYGDVYVLANLSNEPWAVDANVSIAPDGFLLERAAQRGVQNATVDSACSVLTDGDAVRWLWETR